MLRSLFNELWLYLGSAVGVKKNYRHKGRCLKITLLEADHCRKELVIYNALGEKNKSIRHRTHTISTVVMCWKASPLTTKHL